MGRAGNNATQEGDKLEINEGLDRLQPLDIFLNR
jgi:hypothetical protein